MLKLLAVAPQIMTKKPQTEKSKTNPKSPKVFHYSHHFLFFKSLNFSHFFSRNIFRFKISEKAQESSKLKKLGLRKMPEHCNKVLNLHKQVNICCLFSQLVKPENLAPKSLKKRAMNTTWSYSGIIFRFIWIGTGSIHGSKYWDWASRSYFAFFP